MRYSLTACFFLAAATAPAAAQQAGTAAPPPAQTAIAVYADGLSVVRESRTATLPGGPVRIDLPGLPEGLDPSSLSVRIGDAAAGTLALRQDSLDPQSLLRRSVGREVTWLVPVGDTGAEREIRGTLVHAGPPAVLKVGDRYEEMPAGRLALDTLPPGMTGGLEVAAYADAPAGPTPVAVRYIAPALSWSADYEAALLPDESGLILSGHYQIRNDTGTDFAGAALRLVAGETRRMKGGPQPQMMATARMESAPAMDAAAPEPPRGASLGDVHVYDIQGRFDLPAARTVRRILLAPATIPAEKTYTLTGTGLVAYNQSRGTIEGLRPTVTLRFENAEEGPLGRALPAGPVRVYGALSDDAEDAPAVILGEDGIGHLPVGEDAELALGRAFDVTASRRVTDYEPTGAAEKPWQAPYRATHEITLKNGRTEAVTVAVTERFPARRWEVRDASLEAESRDAASATWQVAIPANGETVLTYTVRVTP